MSRRRPSAVSRTRLERSVAPLALAVRAALRWVGSNVRPGDRRAKRDAFALETAEDVARTLGDMKGAAMKLGQILSVMTGTVSETMASQLAGLQANAPPMAPKLVASVFRAEFDRPPRALFRRFARYPFAAASIGQVHRATLHDGREVAVKVQYPGVREAIDHDLANAGLLLQAGGALAPGMDMPRLVEDLKAGIREELDYRQEAAHQRRFADLYRGHAFVRVPEVVDELSTSAVLVQDYIEGEPFAAAKAASQSERDRIAEILYRFAFGSIYRHGLFNGDPHADNYLLLRDGAVAFLDYGCVSEFSPEVIGRFAAVIRALVARDIPAWREATETLGILHAGAPFDDVTVYDHMHWYWAPILEERVTFTPELAGEMVRRNVQTSGKGGAINRYCDVPPGMVFLTRINFGLAGLLGSLNASGGWQGIIEEYVAGRPPTTELGRRSAVTSAGPSI